MEEKICGKCKVQKPISEFSKKKDKFTSKCKECHNEYYLTYWKNTPAYEKHKDRVRSYKEKNKDLVKAQRYGISLEQYMDLKDRSNGLCMICNAYESEAVDHCHLSGKVRGLLCRRCNVGLGWFEDDIIRLQSAIEYLENN